MKKLILKEVVWEDRHNGLFPCIEDTEPMLNNFDDIPKGVKMTMTLEIDDSELEKDLTP